MLFVAAGVMAAAIPLSAQEPESNRSEGSAENPEASATPEDSEEAEAQRQRLRMRLITRAEQQFGDATVSLNTGKLPVDGPDYAMLADIQPGDIVLPTRSQTLKLKTDVPLTFGDVTLTTENVAENYAGVYGVWIKRTDDGWRFIFNEKPDVWGTMYDPAMDVAEIDVDYATLDQPNKELTFEIAENGDRGHLRILWGVHQWTAPFMVAK